MRGLGAAVIVVSCLLLTGCSPVVDSGQPGDDASPASVVLQSATAAFGVPESSVHVDYRTDPQTDRGNWKVVVVLESFDTTAAIDQAAAGVLATVASVDTSDTPISLNVLAQDLAFEESDYEWGALDYWWAALDDATYPRGTEVSLAHTETEPPDGAMGGGIVESRIRGQWQDVDPTVLERWSQEGAPVPVLGDAPPYATEPNPDSAP